VDGVFLCLPNVQTGCGLLDGDRRLDQDTVPVECFNLLLNIAVGK